MVIAAFRLLPLIMLLQSGCIVMQVTPVHSTATSLFAVSERNAVYARGLTALQTRGSYISISDPVGGVLRTEPQQSWVRCSHIVSDSGFNRCLAVEETQLTVGTDGNAFLRIDQSVRGETYVGESPVTPDDRLILQQQCSKMLDFIAGKTAEPPAPPPAPGLFPLAQLSANSGHDTILGKPEIARRMQ